MVRPSINTRIPSGAIHLPAMRTKKKPFPSFKILQEGSFIFQGFVLRLRKGDGWFMEGWTRCWVSFVNSDAKYYFVVWVFWAGRKSFDFDLLDKENIIGVIALYIVSKMDNFDSSLNVQVKKYPKICQIILDHCINCLYLSLFLVILISCVYHRTYLVY